MAFDLHFIKSDSSTSWGFRLIGGVDFGQPLVVVKVNENSLAEDFGLKVDDLIVSINDTCTAGLTLLEVHDLLHKAGNDITLGIRRGEAVNITREEDDEEANKEVTNIFDKSESLINQTENIMTVDKSKLQQVLDDQNKLTEAQNGFKEAQNGFKTSSPNFSRYEELSATEQNKKWSTFLQKPINPIPLTKKQVEDQQSPATPYKVVITKQKKSNTPYKKHVEFKEEIIERVTEIQEESEIQGQSSVEIELNVREIEETSIEIEDQSETSSNHDQESHLAEDAEDESRTFVSEIKSERTASLSDIKLEDIESSLSLEEQLAQVQKQLQALSQLPSAIQVTLDAVSKQLAKIVGAKEDSEEKDSSPKQSSIINIEETDEANKVEISDEDQKTEHDITESIEDLHDEETQSFIENEELLPSDEETEGVNKEENNNDPNFGVSEEEIAAKLEEEAKLAKKQKVNHWNQVWPWSDRPKPIYRYLYFVVLRAGFHIIIFGLKDY